MKKLSYKIILGIIWSIFFVFLLLLFNANQYGDGSFPAEDLVSILASFSMLLAIIWYFLARKQQKTVSKQKSVWWVGWSIPLIIIGLTIITKLDDLPEIFLFLLVAIVIVSVAINSLLYRVTFRSVKNKLLKTVLSFVIAFGFLLIAMPFTAMIIGGILHFGTSYPPGTLYSQDINNSVSIGRHEEIAEKNSQGFVTTYLVDKLMTSALEELDKENYQGAINYIDEALRIAPTDPAIATILTTKIMAQSFDDPIQGLAICNSAIEKNPKEAFGYYCRGFTNVFSYELDDVISDFDKALASEQDAYNIKNEINSRIEDIEKMVKKFTCVTDENNVPLSAEAVKSCKVDVRILHGLSKIQLGQTTEGCNAIKSITQIQLATIDEDLINSINELCNK